jgi:hypothetical protein
MAIDPFAAALREAAQSLKPRPGPRDAILKPG